MYVRIFGLELDMQIMLLSHRSGLGWCRFATQLRNGEI